jgi:hypothetical protein
MTERARPHLVDRAAISRVEEGIDVTHLLGVAEVIVLQDEPQRSTFNAYRVAFRANETDPNLRHAAALVTAWNTFADVMGVGRI